MPLAAANAANDPYKNRGKYLASVFVLKMLMQAFPLLGSGVVVGGEQFMKAGNTAEAAFFCNIIDFGEGFL